MFNDIHQCNVDENNNNNNNCNLIYIYTMKIDRQLIA